MVAKAASFVVHIWLSHIWLSHNASCVGLGPSPLCRKKLLRERIEQARRDGKLRGSSNNNLREALAALKTPASADASALLKKLDVADLASSASGNEGGPNSPAAAAAAAADGAEAVVPPAAEVSTVNFIVKADVQGSVEAVRDAIAGLATAHTAPKFVFVGVGPVTMSDVYLAEATGAKVIAFNLRDPAEDVSAAMKRGKVGMISHKVIYHLMDDVQKVLEEGGGGGGLEEVVGTAQVLQLFPLVKNRKEVGQVLGCRVQDGQLKLGGEVVYRVLRDGEVLWEGTCGSLKKQKEDVDAVDKAQECGVVLGSGQLPVQVQSGDVVQCVVKPMA
jgi:translation initiation factor IF-2